MTLLEFTVPGDPVPKQRARIVRRGVYTPKETVEAERTVGWYAVQAMAAQGVRPDLDVDYALSCVFHLSNFRRVDIDNLQKLIQDALQNVVWRDDSQVMRSEAEKYHDCKYPRTTVRIEVCP